MYLLYISRVLCLLRFYWIFFCVFLVCFCVLSRPYELFCPFLCHSMPFCGHIAQQISANTIDQQILVNNIDWRFSTLTCFCSHTKVSHQMWNLELIKLTVRKENICFQKEYFENKNENSRFRSLMKFTLA